MTRRHEAQKLDDRKQTEDESEAQVRSVRKPRGKSANEKNEPATEE
jgi:hypothetical protein